MSTKLFSRDADVVTRDVQAAHLRAQGWTYQTIGLELGLSRSGAYRAVQRVLTEIQVEAADELRKIEGHRLQQAIKAAFDVLTADEHTVVTTSGKVVKGVRDPAIVLSAARTIERLSQSIRRLYGLDAPTKAEVRVTDDLTAEIQQLAAELAGADRAAADRGEEAAAGSARGEA